MQSTGTIILEILLNAKSLYIYFYNIYYYSKLDSNLLFLEILEQKKFLFVKKYRFFYVINNEKGIIL